MIIKICGLSTPETVTATIEAGADWIGLVFFEKSPRNVTVEQAAELADLARGKVSVVALVVNPSKEKLREIEEKVRPDFIQFHGSESPEVLSNYPFSKVIKALGVREAEDLEKTNQYEDVVSHFLLDAKPPKDANRPGGNGETFDWHLLDDFSPKVPYLLSGGLTLDNVAEAIAEVRPYGIDLSSGVESAPGVKDIKLIQEFIKRARAAERAIGA